MYLILRSKISTKYFYFPQIGINDLKINLSTWNLDYIIPKGISHTSVQNPTYEFQKRNISSIQEIISSIQTTKDCQSCRSLLLVWQICSLNWDLDMDSFVGSLCISFDGPVARYLLAVQGDLSLNSRVLYLLLFQDDILGSLGSNMVFIIPFGIM